MASTYTIADLQTLPDADLNALAAELRGWTLQAVTDPVMRTTFLNWIDGDDVGQYSPDEWQPTTNRNQSGKLLRHAEKQDIQFVVNFLNKMGASIHWREGDYGFWNYVSGNDARAETEAFCAAMLAMEGRLASD